VTVLALSAALLVGVGAAGLEATAQATAEVASGVAPVRPLEPAEPTLVTTLAPSLAGRVFTRRFAFELTYGPRLLLRTPSYVETTTPTLLHQATATQTCRLTPRTDWRNSAAVNYGEVDYLDLGEILESEEARTVTTSRVGVLGTSAQTQLDRAVSRRYRLSLGAGWSRQELVGDTASTTFPTSETGSLQLSQALTLTRVDALSLATAVGQTEYDPGLDYSFGNALMTWNHALSATASTTAAAGVAIYVDDGGDRLTSPMATGSAQSYLGTVGTLRTTGRVTLTLTSTLDPLTGEPREVAGVQIGVEARDAPWSYDASASTFTSLRRRGVTSERTESSASGQASATYRLHRTTAVSFGVRTSWRALDYAGPGGEQSDLEALGFVAIHYQQVVASRAGPR